MNRVPQAPERAARPAAPSARRTARPRRSRLSWLWLILPAVIIAGLFYPPVGLGVAFCFMAAVLSAPFLGRRWCGLWCPRGSFWDNVMSRAIRRPRMPAWAKSRVVRVGVLVVLLGAMTAQVALAWGDWEAVGRVFVTLLVVTTAVGVLMALTGHQRAWCKVCPAGTIAYWLARGRGSQLRLDGAKCTDCRACSAVCPMDLAPHRMAVAEGPTHPDCLKCNACVTRCGAEALRLAAPRTDLAA